VKVIMKIVSIIDPFEDSRWDQFVEDHPFGWVTQLSSWKSVIEKSFKHIKGYYLTLTNESNNEIQAALPIFEIKSWLTGKRLVSIPFATISDPLVSNSEQMRKLIDAALHFARERNITEIEIRSHQSSEFIQHNSFERNLDFKQHCISIDRSLDDVMKSFHRTCIRQKIRQSLENDLNLRIADDERDMLTFYQLYLMLRKRLGLPPQPYKFLKHLWQIFFPMNYLTLHLAEIDGKTVAGQILLKFKDRTSVEFLAYDDYYRNLNPSHFLFWHSIKLAHEEGYKLFDFGRTSVFNESLMEFKGRWGTEVLDLPTYYYSKKVNAQRKSREQSKIYGLVRTVCQKMPSPVFQAFGNFCYHHLG
jgi:serine/alanine adding enzyme